ncbi:MAG: helicase-related protein, partial [Bacteroidota bacterium]
NLTAASNVIHYDLWWNPAVEAQATDRAYRIGQTRNVMVHRFITQNTFEEKINQLLQNKKELADLTVATGEKWIGEFSNEELRDLVKLG